MRKTRNFVTAFFLSLTVSAALAQEWPAWSAQRRDARMKTPACRQFVKVATGEIQQEETGFQTDQLIVLKDGEIAYQWADGVYHVDQLHYLWSASKTITSSLVAAAIHKGDLSLSTRLSEYFPSQQKTDSARRLYEQITVEDLVSMAAGFKWAESYSGNPVESTFLPMLYGPGQGSMHAYALAQPMELSPGLKWNYSGGNSNILMALLRKIYGSTSFVQDLLFSKLGIKRGFFEKDASGDLVGSSYLHLTPLEMAKLGQFWMDGGIWKGERLLPAHWIAEGMKPASSLTRPDSQSDPQTVKAEGVFSARTFWLNQDVPRMNMPHEFKNSPGDMFFAAGHYGQLIVMLPSQKMVLVTTGHNKEYWSKIDRMVSNAVACFASGGEQ